MSKQMYNGKPRFYPGTPPRTIVLADQQNGVEAIDTLTELWVQGYDDMTYADINELRENNDAPK